jgi:predicted transcriptional regulator
MNRMMANLAGLNEGLRVRHIAASPLLKCSVSDELAQVLARADLDGIDQIPIVDDGRIVALREHSDEWKQRPLDDSVLVSADAPLWHFIHTVHKQPYRLVVDKTKIDGIVTWSDLLKPRCWCLPSL